MKNQDEGIYVFFFFFFPSSWRIGLAWPGLTWLDFGPMWIMWCDWLIDTHPPTPSCRASTTSNSIYNAQQDGSLCFFFFFLFPFVLFIIILILLWNEWANQATNVRKRTRARAANSFGTWILISLFTLSRLDSSTRMRRCSITELDSTVGYLLPSANSLTVPMRTLVLREDNNSSSSKTLSAFHWGAVSFIHHRGNWPRQQLFHFQTATCTSFSSRPF